MGPYVVWTVLIVESGVATDALTLQFLEWVDREPRTYAEVMEAWRTSCPRLSIWEDALAERLVEIDAVQTMKEARVRLTPAGRERLAGRPKQAGATEC